MEWLGQRHRNQDIRRRRILREFQTAFIHTRLQPCHAGLRNGRINALEITPRKFGKLSRLADDQSIDCHRLFRKRQLGVGIGKSVNVPTMSLPSAETNALIPAMAFVHCEEWRDRQVRLRDECVAFLFGCSLSVQQALQFMPEALDRRQHSISRGGV